MPSAWALNSRLWQLAAARAHREDSARARKKPSGASVKVLPAFFKKLAGCRAQFAGGKRPAPTEPAGETRALRPCPYRRAAHEKKLGKQGVLVPSGDRSGPTDAAAETGRWATSHRDVAAPKGEPSMCAAKSLRKAKSRLPLWGRCPPKGGGEGNPPSASHNSVSPRRRLWRSSPVGSALRRPNRQVRTKGGTRFGRGDRKARRKPPWHRRCHQETPGEGFLRKTVHRTIFLFSCACWRYKTVGRCPTPCQLSFKKAGQRTLPAYGAHAS